jgi:hypothetical protein
MHNILIVTNDVAPFCNNALTILTFQDSLAEFPKPNEPKTRIKVKFVAICTKPTPDPTKNVNS